MIIGLTGGIASGKSTAAMMLADMGIAVIDADKVGHACIEKGKTRLWIEENCPSAITDSGVDRKVLGGMLFSDAEALKRYNSVVHPELKAEIKRLCEEAEGNVVVEAAVLIEAGWQDIADEIWLVTANEDVRVARIAERNGLSREEALARINAQMSDAEKAKFADVIIDNSGSEADLRQAIARVCRERNL